MDSQIIWGIVAIAGGIFACVYGAILFRFVLAGAGFLIGYQAAYILTSSQPETIRVVISIAVGGILAFTLFLLFRLAIWIAGGLLGLVIALLVASLFNLSDGLANAVVILAGLGLGAFFGRLLGQMIFALASAALGAYAIVYGYSLVFPQTLGIATPGHIPITAPSLGLLAILVVMGMLGQIQLIRMRRPMGAV